MRLEQLKNKNKIVTIRMFSKQNRKFSAKKYIRNVILTLKLVLQNTVLKHWLPF